MKKLIPLALLLLTACNPGSTSSEASQHSEDSNHSPDRTRVAAPDTAPAGSVSPAPAPVAGSSMTELMQRNMQQMMDAPSRGNNDQDFAAQMRIHHQGAVDMAQLELAQGKDEQLRSMAQQIVQGQQAEIAQFDRYLAGNPPAGAQPGSFYQAAHGSMQHPASAAGGSVDEQFARLMIPHHQSGIQMAEQYRQMGKDAALKQIAGAIITAQQKEIATLEAWLKQHSN
ncbi:MAG: DUF305 domain-containing protein [Chitinophagaceae bacterium]|nr:MAG: DUF305 domain-containing protein [Chitinophagaceae bacterium]